MSVFDASQLMFNNPSFYNGVAKQSLNINGNGYLSIQHDTAPTLATKGTVAFWIKLHNNDDRNYVMNTTAGAGVHNNGTMDIRFGGSNTNQGMHIGQYGRTPYTASTTGPKQRDFSAWYHCLVSFDSTSSTASDRQMKIFINGVQVTTGTFGAISQNDLFPLTQQTHEIRIGRHISVGYYLDAYLADFYMIDGQALTPDSFTEIKEGICIPKAYEGTYGNNGFRLEFKETGSGQDANGIGADTSGNNNHFAVTTLSAHDSNMPDSPENNFPTVNALEEYSNTLTEGNLKFVTGNSTNPSLATFSIPTSGKWYWEVYVVTVADMMIGVQNRENVQSNGYSGRKTAYYRQGGSGGGSGSIHIEGTGNGGSQAAYTNGDVVAVLYNADDMEISWRKNGTQQGLTFDVTDTDVAPIIYQASGSGSCSGIFNFGQDSTFAGALSAGNNADANGIGNFKYAPPSGYLALCSANLPDTTLSPNQLEQATDHFNTVLYTGNGGSQSITGVGFQPDWTWIKSRSNSFDHVVTDSSRGVEKELIPNKTDDEAQDSGKGLTSFDSDGFSLVLGTNTSYNNNSVTYVAWNWKANGGTKTTVSIDDISSGVPSIASEVQANTKAGFSIVLYTGTGASSGTIAHGLGAVPKQIWVKNRDAAYNWKVYHAENTSAPETDYLVLDTNDATVDSATHWNDTAPDANVFTIGSSNGLIRNNDKYIAYCFAEIEGYSKFGSYVGNGSTNGTFVFTGFRPAFLMVKRTNAAGNWILYDNTRNPFNVVSQYLYANLSNTEPSDGKVDFVSNGFKQRSPSSYTDDNASGSNYIYMAFAEAPFKFANAR